ncbi:hypothetical protein [Nitratifractor sp.]|uniref:hypothetical protein n=1 Tax=Nitratifractor sp. TaxID=2268144 RepID=UPI0025D45314|nr:hypothetical protein [Nitratifractor sp.]
MVQGMKDRILSKGAQLAINAKIREFGKMLKLDLDSKRKSLEMEVMLEGEKEPLFVSVERYEFFEEDGGYYLRVFGVRTSRAWIDAVASSYLEGRRFEIPAEYAKILRSVI